MTKSLKYSIIAAVTFLIGYIFLQSAYYSSIKMPYVQETILVILGTIATMAVTAALISKQSEVELEKEQRVKIFDLKSELYIELIDLIREIVLKEKILKEDLIKLEFLTHKISILASVDVLEEYSEFIETIKKSAQDEKLSGLESDELSMKLANLCGKIRYDLILRDDKSQFAQSLIKKNIKMF
jgi:hypothetical protein